MTRSALVVNGMVKRFAVRDRGVRAQLTAVDGVDLTLAPGETVAVVGESGSGKSTLARCIARLVEPDAGRVMLDEVDLTGLRRRSLWQAYQRLQMVFQDPMTSLNPQMTVGETIDEPLRLHSRRSRQERRARVEELLADVRLDAALLGRYPRQLSGGQRQRVAIARALAVDPTYLLLDEPTSALDVSVRGQVLDLLSRLREERGLGYLLISHDLSSVRRMADRVLVMYLGSVVETGRTEDVFTNPQHPYTRALLSAAMSTQYGTTTERIRLRGEIPSPVHLPAGCRLASRCPEVQPSCHTARPPLLTVSGGPHLVACPVVLSGHPEVLSSIA
ncbi:oligopeptide/dipeptide ABC transporter ATP-binding protein [Microlunatus antarcticus]|uniref:Peptide/nickel transport system ATP-binding protein/oligopeptide transport system ATP-binding protein n=1 Tax=Microlunatus antarcticus TaxID=53388 RepID=A0A7W5JXX2_9ACTN|nr:ABC transporter ATP-binding protein [Microlunatus antarcticus]MBB3328210.1 peptide/nickel transport system ATP-binding protein/oligopeptide transport system ATP-binding protein [Microlunatus antarcticus]